MATAVEKPFSDESPALELEILEESHCRRTARLYGGVAVKSIPIRLSLHSNSLRYEILLLIRLFLDINFDNQFGYCASTATSSGNYLFPQPLPH
jgi:hypothetical protein